MTVLSSFFKKIKRKPQTLEEKIAGLASLSQESLLVLIKQTEQEVSSKKEQLALSQAAVLDIKDSADLINLAFENIHSQLQQGARLRIAQLLDGETLSFEQFQKKCEKNNPEVNSLQQLSIVGFCQQPNKIEQLINSSSDEQFLYQIALEGVSAKIRKIAAEKIVDEKQLQQLVKATKGKDKQVYKIVKEKCDVNKAHEQKLAANEEKTHHLLELIQAHSKRTIDKLYEAQLITLKSRWKEIKAASLVTGLSKQLKTTHENIDVAIKSCQNTIDQRLKEQQDIEEKAQAKKDAPELQANINLELSSLLTNVFLLENNEKKTIDVVTDQLVQIHHQWQQFETYVSSNESSPTSIASVHQQLVNAVEMELDLLSKKGALQQCMSNVIKNIEEDGINIQKENYNKLKNRLQSVHLVSEHSLPPLIVQALSLVHQYEQQKKKTDQDNKNVLRHISALINKSNTAITSGQSKHAAGIRRSIEEKIKGLLHTPSYLSHQLEELDNSLDKLLDWKSYAVVPKQQELIELMQGLLASNENPEALATKIKRIQDQWKALSKGSQDQQVWEKFHQLAEQAYQPCKDFYEEKAKFRAHNIELRKVLVAQLKDYVLSPPWKSQAIDSVDWRGVQTLIATAIGEWKSYAPVDFETNKFVQVEFDQCLDAIREPLNNFYQSNAEAKKQLIVQAEKLRAVDDSRKAVDDVKVLQGKWKEIGLTARRDDQKLWKEFRLHCDAIFECRNQKSAEFKQELNINKKLAEKLCSEVEKLKKLSGSDLLAARESIEHSRQEFKALGSLPKNVDREINQLFNSATEAVLKKISHQHKVEKEQVWINVLEAANKIRLYQVANKEQAQLKAEAQSFIGSISRWPKNGLQALEMKWAEVVDKASFKDNENSLRMLCIQAEVVSEKPTPDEDKSLRMEFQVKQLERGLGRVVVDKNEKLNALIFEWIAVGPTPTKTSQPLLDRFIQCRY